MELEQRKKYMEIVLKNVAAGVAGIRRERPDYHGGNYPAEQMLEVSAEAILEKDFSSVLDREFVEPIEELAWEMKSSQRDSVEKQISMNLKGKSLSLLINLTALKDEEGAPMGVVAVFDDLTQLIKAQRMAAWREVWPGGSPMRSRIR